MYFFFFFLELYLIAVKEFILFKGYPMKLKGISYFRRMRLLKRLVNNSGACGYQNVFLKRNMGTGIAKNNVSCSQYEFTLSPDKESLQFVSTWKALF